MNRLGFFLLTATILGVLSRSALATEPKAAYALEDSPATDRGHMQAVSGGQS